MISAEIQANNIKVQELANEEGLKVGQNVAAGVAGLVVWPLLFAMDFKGAASKEDRSAASAPAILDDIGDRTVRAAEWRAATGARLCARK